MLDLLLGPEAGDFNPSTRLRADVNALGDDQSGGGKLLWRKVMKSMQFHGDGVGSVSQK